MSKAYVTINGTVYDRMTGLPVRKADTTTQVTRSQTNNIRLRSRTQRSTTLSRKYVKRQATNAMPATAAAKTAKPAVAKSPLIQKYAPHPVMEPAKASEPIAPAIEHPIVVKAAKRAPKPVAPTLRTPADIVKPKPKAQQLSYKPSDVLKAEAIAKALDEAPSPSSTRNRPARRSKKTQRTRQQQFRRAFSFASSGVALLLIAGYITYINMPNLSVRVAAMQTGIDASYPGYRPSGYSISGPVAYNDNEVKMAFAGNGTNKSFTLSQARSGWDSSAVLDNYVTPKAGDDYTTTSVGGLTIYSWEGNAAWVSKGVLHTIEGDVPLSPEQIQRMATSM